MRDHESSSYLTLCSTKGVGHLDDAFRRQEKLEVLHEENMSVADAAFGNQHLFVAWGNLQGSIILGLDSITDNRPSATITFANAKSLTTKTQAEQFVSINPGEKVSVQLQFPPTLATSAVIVQPLDGGIISAADQNNAVGLDGKASLQFRAGMQPGLYRVLVIAGGTSSAIQFWVADATNPPANPPTLKP